MKIDFHADEPKQSFIMRSVVVFNHHGAEHNTMELNP